MRFAYALASLVLLAACASAASPSASTAPPATNPRAPGLAGLLASAGQNNAPSLTLIERTMGPADIRRQDGAGLALTYRMEHCALLLLFAPDSANLMKLAVTHQSAREPGQPTPSLEQCAAEVQDRRHS
jgi:hypothetical protein